MKPHRGSAYIDDTFNEERSGEKCQNDDLLPVNTLGLEPDLVMAQTRHQHLHHCFQKTVANNGNKTEEYHQSVLRLLNMKHTAYYPRKSSQPTDFSSA